MMKTPAEKMGIREGMRTRFVGAPDGVESMLRVPSLDVVERLSGEFRYIHLFTESQDDLSARIPCLKKHLARDGMLWVSWPKGRQRGTDLTLPEVIRIVYGAGLVESTCLSIDETWSALKCTWPRAGTTYRNSHGVLARDDDS